MQRNVVEHKSGAPNSPPSPPPDATNPNRDNTIFDDVYITMLAKMTMLIIPVVNEVFGTNYSLDEECVTLRNEHITRGGKIITDSLVRIKEKLYHIECQSTPDGTMVIRMFEYDFAVALEESYHNKDFTEINFPVSAVVFLRKPSDMTDKLTLKVNFPQNKSIEYEVPVIKVQEYSLDELFNRLC